MPTDILHENNPAITLDNKTKFKLEAIAIIECENKSAIQDVINIGFLPNLSDSLPIYGEAKN